jgi:hypothetical protein
MIFQYHTESLNQRQFLNVRLVNHMLEIIDLHLLSFHFH